MGKFKQKSVKNYVVERVFSSFAIPKYIFFSMSTRAKLSQKEMSRVNFLKLTKKAILERFGNWKFKSKKTVFDGYRRFLPIPKAAQLNYRTKQKC